ncbi:MAG: biotin synthase BioB [Planctomycetota bacterium]
MMSLVQDVPALESLRVAQRLAERALADEPVPMEEALGLLRDAEREGDEAIALPALLSAAYAVRSHYFGNKVRVHVLNNAQNGHCPEDCAYCTQAKTSTADINPYPMKSIDEMLGEAEAAKAAGAHRYCMVFAGRGPSGSRVNQLVTAVGRIKDEVGIEVCVSAGLLKQEQAERLAEAGVDRYNHNLNTSPRNYGTICSTHTYEDRQQTLAAARGAGMSLCSGLIVGMGETREELVDLAVTLRGMEAESIPVNFLLPFEGNLMNRPVDLTPRFCLRVLCLFRLMCPRAEVRVAAGREHHLRSLEPMALQPANSLFLGGYLNAKGGEAKRMYRLLMDAGYELDAEGKASELFEGMSAESFEDNGVAGKAATLTREGQACSVDGASGAAGASPCGGGGGKAVLDRGSIKSLEELRPFKA